VLGSGKKLFLRVALPLRLIESKPFPSGVVLIALRTRMMGYNEYKKCSLASLEEVKLYCTFGDRG